MSTPTLVESHSPAIRAVAKPVGELTKRLRRELAPLAKFLESTPHGVAVAATQLGIPLRAFAYRRIDDTFKLVLDPKVVWTSADDAEEAVVDDDGQTPKVVPQWEQCLSLPGFKFLVTRPYAIKVEYTNERGVRHRQTLVDFSARVFLHEMDHLDGVLISDRASEMGEVSGEEGRSMSL